MSTLSINPTPAPARRSPGRVADDRRPPLARLTAVELRKMVNTRSGFWVLVAVAVMTLLVALISVTNHGGRGSTYTHVFHDASLPSAYLLPIVGILLICGEWTQRTTLTTFTLVPVRRRAIFAKVIASLLVSAGALVVSLAVSILLAAAFGHVPSGPGSLPVVVIVQGWLYLSAGMLMGLAFGAAFLTSAPAIVAFLLVPTIWDAVVGRVNSLADIAVWLDSAHTLAPLTLQPLSALEWEHVGTTLALWIGVPLLAGLWRIRGSDID
jgi:ABC-2 type transport system permease protein